MDPKRTPGALLALRRDDEHPHRCRAGHVWFHGGPSARPCLLREYESKLWDRHVSAEDCPLCTDRDDLTQRGLHEHVCPICHTEWSHDEGCTAGDLAPCAWCFTGSETPESVDEPALRTAEHRHVCTRCGTTWSHVAVCGAPLRTARPECPGCAPRRGSLRLTLRAVRSARRRRRARAVIVGVGLLLAGGVAVAGLATSRWAERAAALWASWMPSSAPQPWEPERAGEPGAASAPVTAPAVTGPPAVALPREGGTPPVAPPSLADPPVAPETPSTPRAASEGAGRALAPQPDSPPAMSSPPGVAADSPVVSAADRPSPPEGVPAAAPAAEAPRRVPPPPLAPSPPAVRAARSPELPIPRPAPSPAGSIATAGGRDRCEPPRTPVTVVARETGVPLGRWIDVEVDRSEGSPRCLYVIERGAQTRWAVDASRVRVSGR